MIRHFEDLQSFFPLVTMLNFNLFSQIFEMLSFKNPKSKYVRTVTGQIYKKNRLKRIVTVGVTF